MWFTSSKSGLSAWEWEMNARGTFMIPKWWYRKLSWIYERKQSSGNRYLGQIIQKLYESNRKSVPDYCKMDFDKEKVAYVIWDLALSHFKRKFCCRKGCRVLQKALEWEKTENMSRWDCPPPKAWARPADDWLLTAATQRRRRGRNVAQRQRKDQSATQEHKERNLEDLRQIIRGK